jgi:hypothetical protein
MNNTCDECKYYDIYNGYCQLVGEFRHSCGEDACDNFEIDEGIEDILADR